jgi:hypothetical protein
MEITYDILDRHAQIIALRWGHEYKTLSPSAGGKNSQSEQQGPVAAEKSHPHYRDGRIARSFQWAIG